MEFFKGVGIGLFITVVLLFLDYRYGYRKEDTVESGSNAEKSDIRLTDDVWKYMYWTGEQQVVQRWTKDSSVGITARSGVFFGKKCLLMTSQYSSSHHIALVCENDPKR